MSILPDDLTEFCNSGSGGFHSLIGLEFTDVTLEELQAQLVVTQKHHQPHGIVHGGVYASIAETMCSVGATLHVISASKSAVGLENSTSFIRAHREGTIYCVATPLTLGRRSHVWETRISDERKRLLALGRVRLMILNSKEQVAGQALTNVKDTLTITT